MEYNRLDPESYVSKIDVDAYLEKNTVVGEWDNTLPVLLFHGLNSVCRGMQSNVVDVINKVAAKEGKKPIYGECIDVGGGQAAFDSIVWSLEKQADHYCKEL